jgi:hypothetical protein
LAREIDDRELVSKALSALGVVVRFLGESTRATLFAEEALDVARSVGDSMLVSRALDCVAFVAPTRDRERALRLEALAFSRRAGDIFGVCQQLRAIGQGEAHWDERLEAGRVRFEEAIAVGEEIGASWYLNLLWIDLGIVLLGEGKFEEAARLCRSSLTLSYRQGARAVTITDLFVLACCATGTGDYRRAAQLTGAFGVLDADLAEVIPIGPRSAPLWSSDCGKRTWHGFAMSSASASSGVHTTLAGGSVSTRRSTWHSAESDRRNERGSLGDWSYRLCR